MSATFLQPFLPYTTKTHTTLTLSAEATYNWEDSQWSVPLNLSLSQVFKIGAQPVSLAIGGRYYAEPGPRTGLGIARCLHSVVSDRHARAVRHRLRQVVPTSSQFAQQRNASTFPIQQAVNSLRTFS